MKVHLSHTGEVAAAQTGRAASTSASPKEASASFASVLASQASTTPATTAPGTDVATTTPAPITLKKGEAMTAVNGHSYSEIHGGQRDGLYVNTTNNTRRGQAFVLVHKHGREYHIYGTGKNRVVVALRKPAHANTQTNTTSNTTSNPASNTATGTGGVTPTVSAS
jgi:hypothetical protein